MKKSICKVFSLFCLLAVMLVPCQAVFASDVEENYTVAPMMTYIADYTIDFSIRNGVAGVIASVDGDVLTATKTKVIAELQVKNGSSWIPVKIWTESQNFYTTEVDETYTVTKGNTYRVKATFTVWEGSASETVTSYSDQITA